MYSGSNLAPSGVTQVGATTMTTMIDRVAASAGLSPRACELVVGTVLSVLQHEDHVHSDAIFARIPGAADLAQAYDVMAPQAETGGMLDILLNRIDTHFSEPVQAGMNGLRRLAQCGLTPEQVKAAATGLFAQMKNAAGPTAVSNVLSSAPALKASLGL